MKTLRVSSFGMRGFVGDSLNPNEVLHYISAFGDFAQRGAVVLGRDTRASSPMLHRLARSALLSAGCHILDLGICPTPMLQFLVSQYGAAGGVSISGGHNVMGWNSLSLIDDRGAFLEPMAGEAVLDSFHGRNFSHTAWDELGRSEDLTDYSSVYFQRLAEVVHTDAIRKAGFNVLIDPIGGAGCHFLSEFAELFGLKWVPINAQPSTYLPREPEPRPRSAGQLASIIQPLKGDVGFVLSSNMVRLALVTEQGEPISEEYTMSIITDSILSRNPGPVVTNSCTTRMLDDLTRARGVPLVKTRVGQAFVMSAAADEHAVLAGEGSGSVALPEFSQAFDGFLMMALILEAMALRGQPLSVLRHDVPSYFITKRFQPCESATAYRALDSVHQYLSRQKGGQESTVDGVRMDWETGWVHVRVSRTENLIRVISEDKDEETANGRADDLLRYLRQTL